MLFNSKRTRNKNQVPYVPYHKTHRVVVWIEFKGSYFPRTDLRTLYFSLPPVPIRSRPTLTFYQINDKYERLLTSFLEHSNEGKKIWKRRCWDSIIPIETKKSIVFTIYKSRSFFFLSFFFLSFLFTLNREIDTNTISSRQYGPPSPQSCFLRTGKKRSFEADDEIE